MDDKNVMENLLMTEKGVCDLFMHGAIEADTQNVQRTFSTALEDALCMQDEIYRKMAQKGWYPTEQAQQQQITRVKNKFSQAASAAN